MKNQSLIINIELWEQLIIDLRKRGNNERESGAFLLSLSGERTIVEYICYDDLDPIALSTGMVTFHADGFVELFKYCADKNLRVIADVHTHPHRNTNQSELDRTHPMMAVAGHVALIIPNYAQGNSKTLRGVSTYEYVTNFEWKKWKPSSKKIKIKK